MERATILGVYDYVGFGLCQSMLESGISVVGVDLAYEENHYSEEMRLQIGRNANFEEAELKDWNGSDSKQILILSLYEKQSFEDRSFEAMIEKLEVMEGTIDKGIIIFPAGRAEKKNQESGLQQRLEAFFTEKQISLIKLYLPTIYGPWQPEKYFFQQALQYSKNKEYLPGLGDRDWVHDALYIEDAVDFILKIAEKENEGEFLVGSGQANQWVRCAEYLLGDEVEKFVQEAGPFPELKRNIKTVTIDQNESRAEGLKNQERQFLRIKKREG